MKRILSTILAIVMVLSVCSCLTFTVSAIEDYERYQIKTNGFKDGQITFDIQLAPNQTIYDAMVSVKYNTSVLEVVKAGPAVTVDEDGNETEVIGGLHEHGVPIDDNQYYTFAYTNSNQDGYKIGSNAKNIFTITFKVKNASTPTSIEFFAGTYESTELIKAYTSIVPLDTPTVTGFWLEDGVLGFSWNAVSGSDGGYFVYKKVDGKFVTLAEGTPATAFKDSNNLVSGTTYTYAVAARDGVYGLPGIMYEFDITYIAPPKTSFEVVNNGIKVTWNAVSGAEKYLVYRSVLTDGVWSEWETVASVNSTMRYWTDKNVTKGVTYKYAASAVVDGVETAYGTDTSVKYVPLITSLATPSVSFENTAKGIAVSWNEIENAESYIVYRSVYNASTKKWSKWASIEKSVTATSYVDGTVKLGTYYKYTVRAVSGDVMSKYVNTKGLSYDVIPTVKVANASNGIKVSWSTAANATGYTVYRSQYDTSTKKWTKWKSRGTAKANVTSWTDKKVTSGVQYKYTVRAINGKVASSYNETGAATLYLAQPTVKIANASTGVKVAWSKVSGATGYTVYRSEYKNGAWTKWASRGTAKANKSSWVDTKVTSGVQYKYTVRAINGKYKSTYVSSSALMYLSQPTVTVAKGSNGINVNWTQSEGATGYTVYRSEYNAKTKKWSNWASMGTTPAPTVSGVDTSAKSGVQYKYTVRAVNGKSKSAYTASKAIKR